MNNKLKEKRIRTEEELRKKEQESLGSGATNPMPVSHTDNRETIVNAPIIGGHIPKGRDLGRTEE